MVIEINSDKRYKRLSPEAFDEAAAGGIAGLRKKKLLTILDNSDDAISTPELRDILSKEDTAVKNTDDILPLLSELEIDGLIRSAKGGVSYYWVKIR